MHDQMHVAALVEEAFQHDVILCRQAAQRRASRVQVGRDLGRRGAVDALPRQPGAGSLGAVVREAGRRTLGMRHFDVQLMGGIVLHQGRIDVRGPTRFQGAGFKTMYLGFPFEWIIDVDDRGIRTLLREVATDQLLLALRGADEVLKEKIFKNMSKRAAEMLKDDLDAAAPAKLSDVERAQKEILQVARRLADAGEMMLGGGGDEFV